jgi:hypothetical protein
LQSFDAQAQARDIRVEDRVDRDDVVGRVLDVAGQALLARDLLDRRAGERMPARDNINSLGTGTQPIASDRTFPRSFLALDVLVLL